MRASPAQAVWELRLSHWTGDLPVLTIDTDWAWHQWDHLFGSFTYGDEPVFGYKSTPAGVPLDTFGRNIYVDTFNSKYGQGWKRENSFLTHTNTGVFCYSFNPHGARTDGKGTQYRATVEGPGVTPDVMWQGDVARHVRQGSRPAQERCDRPARRSAVQGELSVLRS